MVTSDMSLWNTRKSRMRMIHEGDPEPRSIIDINMGCPAKKVCNKAAGSALLKDEQLVAEILRAVVAAVDVPVTLKIRTGWDRDNKNGLTVAKIAEQAGITALAVWPHPRRPYTGEAEYDTIAAIKQAVSMGVCQWRHRFSRESPARAARHRRRWFVDWPGRPGRPWIFREIEHFLRTGEVLPAPELVEVERILLEHLAALHAFYGDVMEYALLASMSAGISQPAGRQGVSRPLQSFG
ncbi:tRNA-dihydrouridine synthase B-like [Drosophila innubila]|uniref:tRNA-dihydrouridine synthase B-like n=1 Tax=Drosophila innubila TaxID=198719 RepID=UPI00148D49AD|nr:tRNA-dihydrouridine synthase B-like [Drosophila innubila]